MEKENFPFESRRTMLDASGSQNIFAEPLKIFLTGGGLE
jgi:hypothetical protein